MTHPERWSVEDLDEADLGRAVVWATPSVERQVRSRFRWPLLPVLAPPPAGTETIVVIGGGSLIDESKALRGRMLPQVRLVVVPSRWGSGAEASPVTVLNREGKKEIHIEPAWLPDVRVVWPELASEIPVEVLRHGCADALAHAVEGFLSPIASEELRVELTSLLGAMCATGVRDSRWFDLAALASDGQARSSVGLVHGVSHVLEGHVRSEQGSAVGHARLCATFLWPVIVFDREKSSKPAELAERHGVDLEAVQSLAASLFELRDYQAALPVLEERFPEVLRDRCSRTNCALVRPGSLDFFRTFAVRQG